MPGCSGVAARSLAAVVADDFGWGLAESTRSIYGRGVALFVEFLVEYGSPLVLEAGFLLSPDVVTLMNFSSWCIKYRKHAVGTVKSTLFGVQSYFIEWGQPSPLHNDRGTTKALLHRHIRALKRRYVVARRVRLPITTVVLRKLVRFFGSAVLANFADNADMWTAALCLGVFGMLRQGEFTASTTKHWNPLRQLSRRDVEFGRSTPGGSVDTMTITIKSSKVDVFRRTHVMTIHGTGDEICPVAALERYITHNPAPPDSPMFQFKDGTFLTRQRLATALRSALGMCGYRQDKYSTHSLRIGGCCSLAAAGYGREVIAVYGRWASNSLELYLQLDRSMLREASLGMARITQSDYDRRGTEGLRRA